MKLLFWLQAIAFDIAYYLLVMVYQKGITPTGFLLPIGSFTAMLGSISLVSRFVAMLVYGCPGPLNWALLDTPLRMSMLSGYHRDKMLALHRKYGKVVRIGTNELSFNSVKALEQIYGNPSIFEKDPRLYSRAVNGEYDINSTRDAKQHARYLEDFAPAFTDQAIKQHEALVQDHVNTFIHSVKARSALDADGDRSTTIDVAFVASLLMGDIAEDLLTGSPGEDGSTRESSAGNRDTAVETSRLSSWLLDFRDGLRIPIYFMMAIDYIGLSADHTGRIMSWIYPASTNYIKENFKTATSKLQQRINTGIGRRDWLTPWMQRFLEDDPSQSQGQRLYKQPQANVAFLQFAGSETTATAIAGVFFALGVFHHVRDDVTRKIRARFTSDEKISFGKLANQHYIDAVVKEVLRLYPPLPMGLPRVAKQNTMVDGTLVKEGFVVSVNHFVMGRTKEHFVEPELFNPERWLDSCPQKYKRDILEASQPFSCGPRACLGERFAWAEMRLIIAKLLWSFDVELVNEDDYKWMKKQKSWFFWDKTPLRMRFKERKN